MKMNRITVLALVSAAALSLTACEKIMETVMFKVALNMVTPEMIHTSILDSIKKDIDSGEISQKPDLTQLRRDDFNHAALRLNLPLYWVHEENASAEFNPKLLAILNFYPDSDRSLWLDKDGNFTQNFFNAYRQMVEVMKDPAFGALPDKAHLLHLRNFGVNLDEDFDNIYQTIGDTFAKQQEMSDLTDLQTKQVMDLAQTIKDSMPPADVLKSEVREYLNKQLAEVKDTRSFSDKEIARLTKVAEELDQSALTLVATDFSASSAEEKQFVTAMLEVGRLIDDLYAKQLGADDAIKHIPAHDAPSRSMLRRNWGVLPQSPKMKDDIECRALPYDIYMSIYPMATQNMPNFCAILDARSDAETLLDHFSVVTETDGKLTPQMYNIKYKGEMNGISEALTKAAGTLEGNEKEKALRDYLVAAAESFKTNNWNTADEAWAAMNSTNSEWYVRVAPDETYWEPCSRHAGFHMSFARINKDALAWQEKLNPLQQDMEKEMAKIAGKPYTARKVSFHLPDFIDIVANNGDDRSAFGATIGQSLPNWGPVANEGRGRTVAMSNLYTDPDSIQARQALASSLFSEKDVELLKNGTVPGLLATILHEAAHNLGPAHEYTVKGKKDNDIYGGALASMAEELKAQSASLWFLPYLVKKGVIDQDLADRSYADDVYWALGHIAEGMTTAEGRIQPYSQLSAIQIGMMLDDGALTFDPNATAANGVDKGIFVIHLDKMPAASEHIMKTIAQSKAKGDKDALVALQKKYVEGNVIPFDLIKERMQMLPKTTFVYSIRL